MFSKEEKSLADAVLGDHVSEYFRGDHIVPNIHEAFPKKKVEETTTKNKSVSDLDR